MNILCGAVYSEGSAQEQYLCPVLQRVYTLLSSKSQLYCFLPSLYFQFTGHGGVPGKEVSVSAMTILKYSPMFL